MPPQGTSYYHLQNILIQDKIIKIKKYNLALKKAQNQATLHRKRTLQAARRVSRLWAGAHPPPADTVRSLAP